MASAAYVDGIESVRAEPRWSDTLSLVLRRQLGRLPTDEEMAAPLDHAVNEATGQVLRELHAEHAEDLPKLTWPSGGETFNLIEDSDLRLHFGPVIGKIAHSHWLAVDLLADLFPAPLGAPAGSPPAWKVNGLQIACLLRLADASHLDSSRAPRFLRAVRPPAGASYDHWAFQGRLSQPYGEGDRFVFTSSPFPVAEAEAWWLCADTLSAVDREFKSVDGLLADLKVPRFAIRGVAGAGDLERLSERIPTDDWSPVDARIHVSDVRGLVSRLGGKELYGVAPHVPLRELIQNASDAVRARRLYEDRPDNWGNVTVRFGTAEHDMWVEVEDDGVGMSTSVLTGNLLDFGNSFWESDRVVEELPGLLGKRFQSTGRFGIGFFSVFMWSEQVQVVSRRLDASQADTFVLQFTEGVAKRPLLRSANKAERLVEPGTCVRVGIDERTARRLGAAVYEQALDGLTNVCTWLAPTLDVNLWVEVGLERRLVIAARDWLEMPFPDLVRRLAFTPGRLMYADDDVETIELEAPEAEANQEQSEQVDQANQLGQEPQDARTSEDPLPTDVGPLLDRGDIVGRAVIRAQEYATGIVTVGGFRSTEIRGISGTLIGQPLSAARRFAHPIIGLDALAAWATEEATRLGEGDFDANGLMEAAGVVRSCGGDTGDLPVTNSAEGLLTRDGVVRWASQRDVIVLLHDAGLWNEVHARGRVKLFDNVLVMSMGSSNLIFEYGYYSHPWPPNKLLDEGPSLLGLALEAIAQGWGLEGSLTSDEWGLVPVGRRRGKDIPLAAHVVRRDKAEG
jgi:hypothetical protein